MGINITTGKKIQNFVEKERKMKIKKKLFRKTLTKIGNLKKMLLK